MFIDNLMNKFGYSEMYEWSELFKYDIIPYGRFVMFDPKSPCKIILADSKDNVIGVTTINTTIVSDNPTEWQGKYLCNEYGDIYLKKRDVAVAQNNYDDINELNYIGTIKKTEVVPVINNNYDPNKQYVKRSDRNEWAAVNILGKCIVVDDGSCEAGGKCTVTSEGKATKANDGYYVIGRLSENTIMIFFK